MGRHTSAAHHQSQLAGKAHHNMTLPLMPQAVTLGPQAGVPVGAMDPAAAAAVAVVRVAVGPAVMAVTVVQRGAAAAAVRAAPA
jgi:hypothetical protein